MFLMTIQAAASPCDSMMGNLDLKKESIVLFDGDCGFCNQSVQFILKHEAGDRLKFGSLQSSVGQEILAKFNLDQKALDSIVLIEKGNAYSKSGAALRIGSYLKWPWKASRVFVLVPRFLRDRFYDFVAKNRYRISGKLEFCNLPSPEGRKRFIDMQMTGSKGP